jgi:hypothetical protein
MPFDRFYCSGTSPQVIFKAPKKAMVKVWAMKEMPDGKTTTTIYVQSSAANCTLDRGTPLPDSGQPLEIVMKPNEPLFAVTDDLGIGGIYWEEIA